MTRQFSLHLGIIAMLGACAPATDAPVQDPVLLAEEASPEWTYDGTTGPRHWAQIAPEYEACGRVGTQSPIDLPLRVRMADLPNVTPEYGDSAIAIQNNGHTLMFSYDVGGTLFVGDAAYELQQFHFHAQSEHTVAGAHRELELHLVHKNAAGQLLVLGVFIHAGPENAALAAAGWNDLPLAEHTSFEDKSRHFDARALIPGGRTYRYQGSLTTPPCSEAVSWIVYERPITMSRAQIRRFLQAYDRDFRPTQPVGARVVQYGE